MNFNKSYDEIIELIHSLKPQSYAYSRNFIDGDVSYLSPYISRGIISTKLVLEILLKNHPDPQTSLKFIQELAWRDYWQIQWKHLGAKINKDLRHPQSPVAHHQIPKAFLNASIGVDALDNAITLLYKEGYVHNHTRMYLASVACNIAQSHWLQPAKWMYYHLLDGDWASNALSWQWVAGSNANKKYYANQENINKYTYSKQSATFLNCTYEELVNMEIPSSLIETTDLHLVSPLPNIPKTSIAKKATAIYNYYNLDPKWKANEDLQRVLLIEPSVFESYPISENCMQFMLFHAQQIPNMKIFVGSFEALQAQIAPHKIYFKEHPLNQHYKGIQENRDWMFLENQSHASFFSFWKKCEKEMSKW